MPDIRNCRKCGKIYNYIGGTPICPVCRQEEEKDFKRVKDYLYKNSGASMTQVSTELDISIEKIKRFLKEGRLEIVEGEGNLFLECESCGKAIKSGRFCEYCERDLAREFQTAAGEISKKLSNTQIGNRSTNMRYHTKLDNKLKD